MRSSSFETADGNEVYERTTKEQALLPLEKDREVPVWRQV